MGWTVIVGERLDQLRASDRRTIAATAGTTLLAFAVGLAYFVGRGLEQNIGTLGIDRNPTRDEFALLFDSAPNGVLLVDDKGLVLLANAQIEQTFDYAPKQLTGKPVETLMPETCRLSHIAHRKQFARHPAARIMGGKIQLLGLHRNGSEFPIEVRLQPIIMQTKHYTIATVIDISARTQAAAALASAEAEHDRLRRDLMRSSDEERLRLSHELHDQTGQTLTAAALAAKDLEKFIASEGRHRIRELNALLDQMGETLHHVAWQLRPTSIDELGLRATLKTCVSDWTDQTGIGTDFYSDNLDALASDVRTTIYRIIQEALTNVRKHAPEANWVSVVIIRSDKLLRLTIEDNGNGFDVAELRNRLSQHRSLGIAGMRERLSLIEGTLDIESGPGNGTTLFARIPLDPAELSL
jgi:PAS domain S-box-containing protein